MKAYLHGARAGKNFKVKNVEFVDGVAEVAQISNYLSKYYDVRDYPPEGFKQEIEDVVQEEETKEEVDEDQEYLRKVIEEKKAQVVSDEPKMSYEEAMEQFEALKTFGEMRKFTQDLTGKKFNGGGKKKAIELIKEHYGVE